MGEHCAIFVLYLQFELEFRSLKTVFLIIFIFKFFMFILLAGK